MSQVALQAEDSLIGVTLDNKYRVIRVIGRGGMGVVYEAEHIALGNRVAIKLMLEKYTNDSEAMTRFTREAHAATRIGNPHIIQVPDISNAPDGRAFVVMELLEGVPLARLLENTGALPPQRALSIMRQVLRAVGAAHAKGIVHRDLKPDNIFLLHQHSDEGGDFVKLLDFGISKIIDPDLSVAATKLTTTGVVMGTPLYMAPEQAMGAEIDHRADIYACGVILYEMLAGKPPFEGQTYAVLVAKLLTTEPPVLSDVRPTLASKLVAAVHRALEKEPKNRYASAEAFSAALPAHQSASAVELAHTMASGPRAAVRRQVRRASSRKWPILGVTLAALAGIATATIVILKQQPATAPTTPTIQAGSTNETQPGKPTVAEIPTGRLNIDSKPTGAMLRVDGKQIARVPLSYSLEAGQHRIELELDGYNTTAVDVEITAGAESPLVVPMFPVEKPTPVTPVTEKTPTQKKTPGQRPNVPRDTPTTSTTATNPPPRTLTVPPPPPPIEKTQLPKTEGTSGPRANPYDPKPNPL